MFLFVWHFQENTVQVKDSTDRGTSFTQLIGWCGWLESQTYPFSTCNAELMAHVFPNLKYSNYIFTALAVVEELFLVTLSKTLVHLILELCVTS